MMEKTFLQEKNIKLFLFTRNLHFWDQCRTFLNQIARKIRWSLTKMIKFEDQKKKLERSSTHIECTFKDTTESFSVDAREYCSNFPKKNVSFWGKNTILSFCTRILLVKEIYRSCLAHTSTKKLRSRERNWGFKRTRTFSSTPWIHFWKHCWKLFCRSSNI